MQHIKLTIQGEFWDTQIYSKKLYIFGDSGDMYVINWNCLIEEYFEKYRLLQTVSHVSFLESDLFYTRSSQTIFKEPNVKNIIQNRFKELANLQVEIKLVGKHVNHKQNPLPFPHTDSEIYYSKIYVALNSGVYTAPCTSGKNTKLWDAPVLNISASNSYTAVALAAGNEGLYEMNAHREKEIPKANQVSNQHCSSCEWSDFNISGSSHVSSSFFAAFRKIKDEKNKNKVIRQFDKIISMDEIFNNDGYSWGSHDKLYMYKNNNIQSITLKDGDNKKPSFNTVGTIPVDHWVDEVISASTAPFGTIIECDNAIIVLQSNGETITIEGEPVNWRVFANSKYYKNQLHIVYEDRLEIHSFYHDYFIDQTTKISGIEMA